MRHRVEIAAVGALTGLAALLVPVIVVLPATASPTTDGRTGPWEPVLTLVPEDRVDGGLRPPVAVTDAGRAVTVWVRDNPDLASDRLYAHVREPGAAGWSDRMLLSGDEHVFNAVVVSHLSNNVTVAWQAFDADHDAQVLTRTLHDDGQWSQPFVVADYDIRPGTGARVELNLAVTGRHKVLAWHQPQGLFTRVRTADGTWLPADRLPTAGRSGATDAVAIDDQGRAHVLGQRAARPRNELVHWLLEPGSTGWDPTVLGTIAGRRNVPRPALGSNPAGDLVASWTRSNPADGHQQGVVRSRPAGADWGEPQLLPTRSTAMDVQLDDSAGVTLFWEQRGRGYEGRLERRALDGTILWQRSTGHTTQIYRVLGDIDVNDAGQVVVLYRTSRRDSGGDLKTHGWTIRCDAAGSCEPRSRGDVPWGKGPQLGLGADGAATFVWQTGCRTEQCLATRVLSRRLLPAA